MAYSNGETTSYLTLSAHFRKPQQQLQITKCTSTGRRASSIAECPDSLAQDVFTLSG